MIQKTEEQNGNKRADSDIKNKVNPDNLMSENRTAFHFMVTFGVF